MTTDRAALEKATAEISQVTSYGSWYFSPDRFDYLRAVLAAAQAHLSTLPKTKMVEVSFVARLSDDGEVVCICVRDTPDSRFMVGQHVITQGGQMVILKGIVEVPAT